MSDGNFNRTLLPSTPYRSGIKMGQRQAKVKAEEALRLVVEEITNPPLSPEQKEAILTGFMRAFRL